MNVILNVDSLLKPNGGIGRYTDNILRHLHSNNKISRLECFYGCTFIKPEEFINTLNQHQINACTSPTTGRLHWLLRRIPYSSPLSYFIKNLIFFIKSKRLTTTIYHEPNYILKPFNGPTIATIHDLSHLKYPEHHPSDRVLFLNKNLLKTIKSASHIITDSEFTRSELINEFSLNENKITAIPLGVNAEFHPRTQSQTKYILSNYGLAYDQYLLSVATIEPRKNIENILDAYMMLDNNLRKKYPLVLIGCPGWKNEEIQTKITKLSAQNEIKWLGYVSENDLPPILSSSRAAIFTPLYEGFGLPALEALASGVPLLTSDVASIPELVDNAAIMCDPLSTTSITNGMQHILNDDNLREQLITRGINRSADYTWDECTNKTISLYKKVLQRYNT